MKELVVAYQEWTASEEEKQRRVDRVFDFIFSKVLDSITTVSGIDNNPFNFSGVDSITSVSGLDLRRQYFAY